MVWRRTPMQDAARVRREHSCAAIVHCWRRRTKELSILFSTPSSLAAPAAHLEPVNPFQPFQLFQPFSTQPFQPSQFLFNNLNPFNNPFTAMSTFPTPAAFFNPSTFARGEGLLRVQGCLAWLRGGGRAGAWSWPR